MRTRYRHAVVWLYFFMAPPLMYWFLCVLSRVLSLSSVFEPYSYQSALFFNLDTFSFYLAWLFPEAVIGATVFVAFIAILAFYRDGLRIRKWLVWGIAVAILAYLVILAPHVFGFILSFPRPQYL